MFKNLLGQFLGDLDRGSIKFVFDDGYNFSLSKLYTYEGLKKVESEQATTGDIIGIAGMKEVEIGETIADTEFPDALPVIEIDEPTLAIHFSLNSSPFSGREGGHPFRSDPPSF